MTFTSIFECCQRLRFGNVVPDVLIRSVAVADSVVVLFSAQGHEGGRPRQAVQELHLAVGCVAQGKR
jgi:hypothetical protein